MLWQSPLPPKYTSMSDDALAAAIRARKAELGSKLVILGHHYQQDEVIQFADFTGDSFKLSQLAADQVRKSGAKYVIFCGVHFMAESADVLAPQGTTVILPDMGAGCSMADMANEQQTVEAWGEIAEVLQRREEETKRRRDGETERRTNVAAGHFVSSSLDLTVSSHPVSSIRIIPICYMNSTAAIKAFCGEHGGAVCTSSNCARVFEWALAGGTQPKREGEEIKILFLPDQHLGRNTAAAMGYDTIANMALWDPKHADGLGGLQGEDIERATFILWKGHCSVHMLFRPEHVDQMRASWPDVTVIVHPECRHDVVQKADMTGSTEGIMQVIREAKPGTRWAVGTEVHMVNRLAKEAAARGVTVRILSDCQCLCTTMFRIDMPHLLWTLDNLAAGKVVNQVQVDVKVKHWALVALDRMLQLTGSGKVTKSTAAVAVSTAAID